MGQHVEEETQQSPELSQEEKAVLIQALKAKFGPRFDQLLDLDLYDKQYEGHMNLTGDSRVQELTVKAFGRKGAVHDTWAIIQVWLHDPKHMRNRKIVTKAHQELLELQFLVMGEILKRHYQEISPSISEEVLDVFSLPLLTAQASSNESLNR